MVIASNNYVFIHFPKTGGTRIEEVLTKYDGEIYYIFKDEDKLWTMRDNLRTLDKIDLTGKFVFGFIRNPWDFYFSLFYFFKGEHHNYTCLKFCSNNFKHDFLTTIKKLLLPKEFMTKEEYNNYLKYITITGASTFSKNDFKITIEDFYFMQRNNIGFLSLLYYMFFFGNYDYTKQISNLALRKNMNIFKYERLKETFQEISYSTLGLNSVKLVDEFDVFSNFNKEKPEIHYSNFYDAELRDIIMQKDSGIIQDYAYTFI